MNEPNQGFSPRRWASGLVVAAVLAGVIGVATVRGRQGTPHPAPAAVAEAPTPSATATSTDDPTADATPDATPSAMPSTPAATSAPVVRAPAPTPTPAPTWTVENSGTTNDLWAVDFVDSTHGWATGDHGTILATTDGGVTWTAKDSGTIQSLRSVSFVDEQHGWVAGAATLLSTDDGGATWTPRPGSPAGTWVQFVDADHGWTLAQGALFATSDGGVHWTAVPVMPTIFLGGDITAAHFADATHGWVLEGWGQSLVATADGGQTWTVAARGYPPMGQIAASDPDHAWMVDLSPAPLLFATVDGATWRMVHAADNGTLVYRPESVSSPDTDHVWLVGGSGTQHPTGWEQSSSDGGKTWATALIPIQGDGLLLAVSAPDAGDAWAVGDGGTIVKLTK